MTPAAIICEAAADGVSLELSPAGTIKATGDQASVNRWLPVLRENKHALLEALAHPDSLPPLPRGLGGYAGPPRVPPLGDCELARQIRSMPEGDARLSAEDLDIKAGALWWRIAITEPGGRTIEVDFPSGLTLCEATAYAERYHAPGCAVTPIAGLPKPRGTSQPR